MTEELGKIIQGGKNTPHSNFQENTICITTYNYSHASFILQAIAPFRFEAECDIDMGVAGCGHCRSVMELIEATGTTHLVASDLNFASTAISCPSSPISLEIERAANVVAITIQRLSSARNRPGQILYIHSKLVADRLRVGVQ